MPCCSKRSEVHAQGPLDMHEGKACLADGTSSSSAESQGRLPRLAACMALRLGAGRGPAKPRDASACSASAAASRTCTAHSQQGPDLRLYGTP